MNALGPIVGGIAVSVAGFLVSLSANALVELSDVSKIAAGSAHTCALTTAGGVKCWGNNLSGQLGDNSTLDRLTPVDVSGLGSGIASIAAGAAHTCALTAAGGVACWGYNSNGQLGDGTTTQRLTPVPVSGLGGGVVAISAGWRHTCALTTVGGVKCWGENAHDQLGDGTTTQRLTPVDASGLASGVTAITAASSHTCALTTSGGVKCWGANADDYGGLVSAPTPQRTPVDVPGLASGVTAIAAGDSHACALTTTGGVKCWGYGYDGQLGNNSWTMHSVAPGDVSGLRSGAAAIAAGGNHTCALTTAGSVKCWGRNDNGELGDNSFTRRSTPVDVSGLKSGVAAITAGAEHTCALTTAGTVKCWGHDIDGQLGDNSNGRRLTPTDVLGLGSGATAIAAGGLHTCALTTAGGVKCWGYYDGIGWFERVPVDVSGLESGVAAITAGEVHDCAVTIVGGAKCWGGNMWGQLGTGTYNGTDEPVDVVGLASGVTSIAAAKTHTCALTTAGEVKCWGDSFGVCSYFTNACRPDDRVKPVEVPGLGGGVVAITGNCALTTAGGVKCWRYQGYDDPLTLVDVPGLESGMTAIAAGGSHTCAITPAGGVKCWGNNGSGQLGDGTTSQRLMPVDVSGLGSGVVSIAVGGSHTCAITTVGGVKCWGSNGDGQLGDGTTSRRLTPVDVSGLGSGVVAIAAGTQHTCAITTVGGVKCWGYSRFGQTGDGTERESRPYPAPVLASAPAGYIANYTDLWWNSSESGWGINVNHQGNIIFAALYTYDANGAPMWLYMPNGETQPDGSFLGTLYRSSGPPFYAFPWTSNVSTPVGTMHLTFTSINAATLAYSVDGINATKSISRFQFSTPTTCSWTESDRSAATNYQDLWWNPAESGWGVTIAHQGNTLFAALFTYDSDGRGLWLSMSNGAQVGSRTYSGSLYRSSGPPFNASSWGAFHLTTVGTMTFSFTDGNNGTITYSVGGIEVVKSIRRFVFSSPKPQCDS